MPQLNLIPWLATLLFSWSVLLIVIPPKVLSHTFPNELTSLSTEKPKTHPWNWPWH